MRIIIADIDGCLHTDESIPLDLDTFWELARRCRQAAEGTNNLPPLTICTGRPQPYAEALMKLLDVRAPAICENGAVLYSLADNWARYGPGVTAEKIAGLHAVGAFIESEIIPQFPEAVRQFGKEAQLSIYSNRFAIFQPIKERIETFTAQRGGPELIINTSPYYLNISLAGIDKGSTLRFLLDELGIPCEEAAGVGDSEGDLPLREAVGYFACPANAQPCIKDAADYISPYPDTKGMLDILEQPELRAEIQERDEKR